MVKLNDITLSWHELTFILCCTADDSFLTSFSITKRRQSNTFTNKIDTNNFLTLPGISGTCLVSAKMYYYYYYYYHYIHINIIVKKHDSVELSWCLSSKRMFKSQWKAIISLKTNRGCDNLVSILLHLADYWMKLKSLW